MTNPKYPKWEEIILVVDRKDLFENEMLTFQGTETRQRNVVRLLNNINSNYRPMRRGGTDDPTPKDNNAELNLDYKQPIPYAVIRRGDEFFVTERLEGGGESRLHGKLSMGAGGHMNPVENAQRFSDVLKVNLNRELEEELYIEDMLYTEVIGYINDDSDDVGKVHIGILVILDVEGEVEVLETEQLKGSWFTLEELRTKDIYDRLENWGKIVVDML
jgi:predicted NUDIX family phosphoesterase